MRSSARRTTALLWALATLPACTRSPTQLLVYVDSDYQVPQELSAIEVIVRDADGSATREIPLEAGLPASFAILAESGMEERPITIELSAFGSGRSTLVRRTITTSFFADEILFLPVYLTRNCQGVSCGNDTTCSERGCVPIAVAPDELKELDVNDPIEHDAGVPLRRDGSVGGDDASTDSGVRSDASVSDALAPDAVAPRDASSSDAGVHPDAAALDSGVHPDAAALDSGELLSCVGLAEECGVNRDQNCCQSPPVPGGTFHMGRAPTIRTSCQISLCTPTSFPAST
ncbi:MAG: hypothetical protein HYV07_08895 [Deltaproteobacteria bacterium]|nr:hypothetical protein [Deltaproteobacteria bacterium]